MWPVPLTQVLYHHVLNWFFLPKPQFWEFIWIFSSRNHQLKINISHILKSKSYQINSMKSCSSRSFQETPKAHSNSSEIFNYYLFSFNFIFSEKKSFNIQELLHCQSKSHGTKPMHPFLSRAFQRHQEQELEASPFGGLLIITKQNKLLSFIVRSMGWATSTGKKNVIIGENIMVKWTPPPPPRPARFGELGSCQT